MAKTPARKLGTHGGSTIRQASIRGKGRHTKVSFGAVTVTVPKPSSAQVESNVAKSAEALERAKKRFVKAGVRLPARKDVPLYSADPDRPGVYIRKLNGVIDRGVLENGVFKVTG